MCVCVCAALLLLISKIRYFLLASRLGSAYTGLQHWKLFLLVSNIWSNYSCWKMGDLKGLVLAFLFSFSFGWPKGFGADFKTSFLENNLESTLYLEEKKDIKPKLLGE